MALMTPYNVAQPKPEEQQAMVQNPNQQFQPIWDEKQTRQHIANQKKFAPQEKAINPVSRKYACESWRYKASQKIQLNVHLTLVHNIENPVFLSRPDKSGRARISGHLGKFARITPGFL